MAQQSRDFAQHQTSLAHQTNMLAMLYSHFVDDHDIKDLDPTPRGTQEPWRFTPSLLDPNSFAFSNFANQPPGYYTPTPGGTNTLYHNQAGDLHTPGLSMGLGTPLSVPTSEGPFPAANGSMHGFAVQGIAPHLFHNPNPFAFQQQHPQTFAPHQFSHQPSPYDTFEPHHDEPKPDEMRLDVEMHERTPIVPIQAPSIETVLRKPLPPPSLEKLVSETYF
jgi:hypothetical protein